MMGESEWGPILGAADPTAALLQEHRERIRQLPPPAPTGGSRADYLRLIAGAVDFWRTQQNRDGAIIDPYRGVEFQYSTPAFAHATAALVTFAGRDDLLETAALALDWSVWTLAERRAASAHEDFFAPLIAHALRLLGPHVSESQRQRWEENIRRFDPYATYRSPIARRHNWNLVAACGEALFQQMGLRVPNHPFVEESFAHQGARFDTAFGLYCEGPMAYDHFPRLWGADLIACGYQGPFSPELTEALRRAAITSLFLQSPWGELPAGGRSAHHQWNEAQQCVTFEVFAARAQEEGDTELAGIYKRAARRACASLFRWVRPDGSLFIVKNRVDPAKNHGYESYSGHSQYNLLPLAMLAIACDHAATTEHLLEHCTPAEVGGFVLEIAPLHKVIANAGGVYVEMDTAADHHYDATGLIRIHTPDVSPCLGPSDSILAHPAYTVPEDSPIPPTTGIGIAWPGKDGKWQSLGASSPQAVTVTSGDTFPNQVTFTVRYEGVSAEVPHVEETYRLTPAGVLVCTRTPGYDGPLQYLIPVLVGDGTTDTIVQVTDSGVSVCFADGGESAARTFTSPSVASVQLSAEAYPNHNGWAKLAILEYTPGAGKNGVCLEIGSK